MLKILVVDDSFEDRCLTAEILKNKADCDFAACGNDALKAFNISQEKQKPYDLILLDISMPDMNGIDVLNGIRREEDKNGIRLGEGVPIIMVTLHKEAFLEAFKKGCDNYILKPINAKSLISKIEEIIPKR